MILRWLRGEFRRIEQAGETIHQNRAGDDLQWIRLDDGHHRYGAGDGTRVAVLDTAPPPVGHSARDALASATVANGVDTAADTGHGARMASVVHRVAPDATLLHGQVLGGEHGRGTMAQLAEGIRWAVESGADVISMSLAGGRAPTVLRQAVQLALDADCLLFAAVGNDYGQHDWRSPASLTGVHAVGALDRWRDHAQFANALPGPRGTDYVLPGVQVRAQGADLQWSRIAGTSPATAMAAGMAAVVLSHLQARDLDDPAGRTIAALGQLAQDAGPQGRDPEYGDGALRFPLRR